jgi:hypothetical protein
VGFGVGEAQRVPVLVEEVGLVSAPVLDQIEQCGRRSAGRAASFGYRTTGDSLQCRLPARLVTA